MAKPQFSLRFLFVVTAAAALLLGEAVAFPEWLAFIAGALFVSFACPALVSGIVYGRGAVQAFCLGALVWWLSLGVLLVYFDGLIGIGINSRIDFCILWLLDGVGGIVAVTVRRLVMSKSLGRAAIATAEPSVASPVGGEHVATFGDEDS